MTDGQAHGCVGCPNLPYLQRVKRTLQYNTFYSNPVIAELVSGWILLCMGIILLLPAISFSEPEYDRITRVISETAWGVLLFLQGMFQVVAPLSEEVRVKWMRFLRSLANILSAFIWLYFSYSFLLFYPPAPFTAVSVILALSSLWAFIRSNDGYKIYW